MASVLFEIFDSSDMFSFLRLLACSSADGVGTLLRLSLASAMLVRTGEVREDGEEVLKRLGRC